MLGVSSGQIIALAKFAVGFYWVRSSLAAHRFMEVYA